MSFLATDRAGQPSHLLSSKLPKSLWFALSQVCLLPFVFIDITEFFTCYTIRYYGSSIWRNTVFFFCEDQFASIFPNLVMIYETHNHFKLPTLGTQIEIETYTFRIHAKNNKFNSRIVPHLKNRSSNRVGNIMLFCSNGSKSERWQNVISTSNTTVSTADIFASKSFSMHNQLPHTHCSCSFS